MDSPLKGLHETFRACCVSEKIRWTKKMINNVNEMFEMYKIKGPVCVLASLFQDRNRIVKTI